MSDKRMTMLSFIYNIWANLNLNSVKRIQGQTNRNRLRITFPILNQICQQLQKGVYNLYIEQYTKYKTDKLNKAKIIKKTKTKQKSLKKRISVLQK
jgi:hypothetical protein